MQLTYLGHAGFCVDLPGAIVVMDPWVSRQGAFDSAWFQFPRNHHLAQPLREKLQTANKECFIYISHEHHDHFDPEFLRTLPNEKLTYVLPKFNRDELRRAIAKYNPKALIACEHGKEIAIPSGYLKLYLDDSGLNRDSGVLLKTEAMTFLNLNDCKLYDQLQQIVQDEGPISVFTCQFSGATWHPVCYEYPLDEYERISRQKVQTKFEMIARAIEIAKASVYVPSAGPACFLDPSLMHLNFERINIFPRADQFLDFLQNRLVRAPTRPIEMMPGEVLQVQDSEILNGATERVGENNLRSYLEAYSAEYQEYFERRQPEHSDEDCQEILDKLSLALLEKLYQFTLHKRVLVPLYFSFTNWPARMLRIDFPKCTIEQVEGIREHDFYSIAASSWQIERILTRDITWEDFALTFRMKLNRKPDVYQTLMQGFLLMEPADMNWFCEKLLEIEDKKNRVVVEAGGTRYSIDRYCPHQGADLSQGWLEDGNLWTCPRHRWQFDLNQGGCSVTSTGSIHAVCLEGE